MAIKFCPAGPLKNLRDNLYIRISTLKSLSYYVPALLNVDGGAEENTDDDDLSNPRFEQT